MGPVTLADDGTSTALVDLRGQAPEAVSSIGVHVAMSHPNTGQLSIALIGEPAAAGAALGVELLNWQRSGWQVLATNTASELPVDGSWDLHFEATDAAAVQRLFAGPPLDLNVALSPIGTNGLGRAVLQTDQIELGVRYTAVP